MVSKASEDFPLPLGPVTTVNFPSGRSRSMPLRLFWRAPRISTQPRSGGAATHGSSVLVETTEDNPLPKSEAQILGSTSWQSWGAARRAVCFYSLDFSLA